MANTTNFGWETPDDTDLVKDGAAAMRTLGNAIDASLVDLKGGTTGQVLAKNSNTDMDFVWTAGGDITEVAAGTGLSGGGTSGSVTLSLSTPVSATNGGTAQTTYATGDLLYASAANTLAKRAIGTTGQVLTVSGGVPDWAAAPTSSANFSLINTGGTALTGAATITVSGISNADKLLILFESMSSASASSVFSLRINSDSTSKYSHYGFRAIGNSTWSDDNFAGWGSTNASSIRLCQMGANAGSNALGFIQILGGNTAGVKTFNTSFGVGGDAPTDSFVIGGIYTGTSTISSISVISGTGDFDQGTMWVYASA